MDTELASNVRVGTCNWADHTDFYPKGIRPTERLSYYAEHFSVVEVDSSYYHLLPARNFAMWAERTPPGFDFDVKAYRELTWHDRGPDNQPRAPAPDTFARFAASLQPLAEANKLRAILFQFPPWFRCEPRNADYLAGCPEFFPGQRLAVEFRHRSWFDPENRDATLAFLRQHRFVNVMVDEPQLGSGSIPPVVAVTNPDLAIARFHGRNRQTWYARTATSGGRFDYLYAPAELAEWLPALKDVAAQAREVHVLLNNCRANYGVRNAKDFQALLGQTVLPLEPTEPPTLF